MHPRQYEELGPQPVRLLTIPQACERLGCSRGYFYATPALMALTVKLGAGRRVRSDLLEAYILNLPSHDAAGAQ